MPGAFFGRAGPRGKVTEGVTTLCMNDHSYKIAILLQQPKYSSVFDSPLIIKERGIRGLLILMHGEFIFAKAGPFAQCMFARPRMTRIFEEKRRTTPILFRLPTRHVA